MESQNGAALEDRNIFFCVPLLTSPLHLSRPVLTCSTTSYGPPRAINVLTRAGGTDMGTPPPRSPLPSLTYNGHVVNRQRVMKAVVACLRAWQFLLHCLASELGHPHSVLRPLTHCLVGPL